MKLKSKFFAGVVGAAMILSFAVPASAQTTAELTAQINSLLAMIAQLQAQIAGGSSTSTGGASMMFTSDLTIGSTGSEVTALQQWLSSKGYLMMPAGVAYGYFGNLTKSALAKYQAEAGISPASGYFGPITRAKLNAMASTGGTTTGGTTTGGTTTGSTGITTPGVEGTLTVTSNSSGLVSTVYEGDSMVGVLGFNVEAKTSDIAIQRIKLQLGDDSTILWRKGYSRLYVTEGGNTLASIDLNSGTVVKEGSDYYVTITGFNLIVPKGAKKQIVIKADAYSSIDSVDMDGSADSLDLAPLALIVNGVRGVDGAGIDQYSPATAISRTTSFSGELAGTASLKVSLNNSSPKAVDVIADSGSGDNELDKLTTLVFDLKAEKDDVTVNDMRIGVVESVSGGASAQTAYLFDGSTEIDSASITNGMASFTDIDYVVPQDSTKTLTVKVDFRDATTAIARFVTTASTTDSASLVAENSLGDSIDATGSATGYTMGVRSSGVEITLVSKSSVVTGTNGDSAGTSTSTLSATFNVRIKALGSDVILGTVASTAPVFSPSNSFQLFRNGVASSINLTGGAATTTSFTIPSTCTPISGLDSCTLAEGSEVVIPVTFQIPGRTDTSAAHTSGLYSVELQRVNWGVEGTSYSDFMNGEIEWRTADVSFP